MFLRLPKTLARMPKCSVIIDISFLSCSAPSQPAATVAPKYSVPAMEYWDKMVPRCVEFVKKQKAEGHKLVDDRD